MNASRREEKVSRNKMKNKTGEIEGNQREKKKEK